MEVYSSLTDSSASGGARALDPAFHRRLMEGVDEEEERAWAEPTHAARTSRHFTSSESIRNPRASINAQMDDFPISADSAQGDLLAATYSFHPRPTPARQWCSDRWKTIGVLAVGVGLILLVVVLFLVLLHKNLHPARHESVNKNAFRLQVLGQTVLHYDLTQDQNGSDSSAPVQSDWSARSQQWVADWRQQLNGDFVLTDMETTLTGPYGGVDWRQSVYSHIAPPSTLDILLRMGINTFVCSNNHAYDLELPGLYNLMAAFLARNRTCAGIGINEAQATDASVLRDRLQKGLNLAIVSMASGSINDSSVATPTRAGINDLRVDVNGVPDPTDLAAQVAAITQAVDAPGTDLVVVYHHCHYQQNLSADPHLVDPWRVALAHQFIDLGAAMYVSHGLPYPMAIEIYRSSAILYGAGNFIFQSKAGPDRWGNESYEGVIFDAEYGCVPCQGTNMPVASIGGLMTTTTRRRAAGGPGRNPKIARSLGSPSFPPHQRQRQHPPPRSPSDGPPAFREMPTHDDAWAAAGHADLDSPHPAGADSDPPQAAFDSAPPGVDPDLLAPPTLPTPSSPNVATTCPCGYRLTSLLVRPIALVRPDLPVASPALTFNHSFGLPTLDMELARATAVLESIQQLSRAYGTQMEIVHSVGQPPQVEGMHSQVFARVQLDP